MSEKAETLSHIQRQPLRIENIYSQHLKEIKAQIIKISLKWSHRLVYLTHFGTISNFVIDTLKKLQANHICDREIVSGF